MAQKQTKRRETGYMVQPKYIRPRVGDDKAGERMRKLFVPATKKAFMSTDSMGNLHMHSFFDKKLGRVVMRKNWYTISELEDRDGVPMYKAISSALALYRGICLFPRPNVICFGSDGYKFPWALPLKHVETGELLILCEWKGGFGFHTRFHGLKEAPKTFIRDACRLLTLMMSNTCPHPYDQVVAGSVA